MQYHIMPGGSTSETVLLEVRANNGTPQTGLVFNSAGLVARYVRPGEAPVAITLVNQTVTGAYVSGGFKEIDATNCPGLYRFDIPDAAIATGKDQVVVSLHGYGSSSTAYYTFQLGGILTEAKIATASYKLKSDQTTCDDKLDIYVGNTLTINLQLVDANLVPVAVGTSTCTVRVFDLSGNFVTNYTPTVQYNSNGEITFDLSTAVTSVAGTYNIYVSRVGASDTVSFGPLQLRVRSL